MWWVSYTYDVNTSITYYVHKHMLRLRMRSLPWFVCTWYVFGLVCVRGQYLNCVSRWTLIFGCFVCIEGICLDYVSRLHFFWLFNVTICLIYAYVVTCIRIWSYICDIWTYVYILYYVIYIECCPCREKDVGGHPHIFVRMALSPSLFQQFFCWHPRWSLWYLVM